MSDTSRFPEGVLISVAALTEAKPVGTIVLYTVDNQLYRSTNAAVATWVALGTSITDVTDSTFRIVDNVDATKEIAFQASGITTGTTRTLTMSNFDFNLQVQGLFPNNTIADPGTGAAIPVTASGMLVITLGAGAETNTITAVGTVAGQCLYIVASGGAGSRAITFNTSIDSIGNSVATMDVGDEILVFSSGTSWRLLLNNGAVLS